MFFSEFFKKLDMTLKIEFILFNIQIFLETDIGFVLALGRKLDKDMEDITDQFI